MCAILSGHFHFTLVVLFYFWHHYCCLLLSLCGMCECGCACTIARVKARKPCGVGCLFLPLCGFWGSNLGQQTYMASASSTEPLLHLFVYCLRPMSLRFSKLLIWSPFLYLPHPEIVGMILSTRLLYPCFSEQMVF